MQVREEVGRKPVVWLFWKQQETLLSRFPPECFQLRKFNIMLIVKRTAYKNSFVHKIACTKGCTRSERHKLSANTLGLSKFIYHVTKWMIRILVNSEVVSSDTEDPFLPLCWPCLLLEFQATIACKCPIWTILLPEKKKKRRDGEERIFFVFLLEGTILQKSQETSHLFPWSGLKKHAPLGYKKGYVTRVSYL